MVLGLKHPARPAADVRHHLLQFLDARAQELQPGDGGRPRARPTADPDTEAAEGEQREGVLQDLPHHDVEVRPGELPQIRIRDDLDAASGAPRKPELSLDGACMEAGRPAPARHARRPGTKRLKRRPVDQEIGVLGVRTIAELEHITTRLLHDGAGLSLWPDRPDRA
ncbi:hypothetical protein D3C72_1360330 [compost metagenome]